jgi:hypothetical protein
MDLEVFDITQARKQKTGRPTIRIDFKVGTIMIGCAAIKLMDLKAKDQVKAGYDKNSDDWYLWKVKKDGFTLRSRSNKNNNGLIFNSRAITDKIARTTGCELDSAMIQVGQ